MKHVIFTIRFTCTTVALCLSSTVLSHDLYRTIILVQNQGDVPEDCFDINLTPEEMAECLLEKKTKLLTLVIQKYLRIQLRLLSDRLLH